MSLQGGAIREK